MTSVMPDVPIDPDYWDAEVPIAANDPGGE
jgi:hypothetical protein